MPSCRDVTRAIAADEIAESRWSRRLSVRLHLLMCRHCRRYAAQMRAIAVAARQVFTSEEVDAESRERLRSAILERIPCAEDNDSADRV